MSMIDNAIGKKMALNLDETINYCEKYISEHEIFDNSTCPYKELGREDGEWKDTCRLPSNIPKGSSWGDCNKESCPLFSKNIRLANIHRQIDEYLKELKQLLREERPHGKWERHYSRPGVYADLFWHCSNCGYKCREDNANIYYKYCPNCESYNKEVTND